MDHEAVAAFVFLRAEPRPQVLVGIRRPEFNDRHPGVVSVPTIRIPHELALQLACLASAGLPGLSGLPGLLGADGRGRGHRRAFGLPRATTTVEGLLVETVLAKKLRMGDALESGLVSGECFVHCVLRGDVEDPTGRDGSVEPTFMVALVARIHSGPDVFPVSTASYSALSWADPEEFVTAWRTRDGQRLFPDASPLEVCIRGLCVQAAVRVLERENADVA
ncbi:hypothetical protein [Streptomyces sp. NPDC086787]|uniref:hypothetical protein n=1 Tax=Streptomyces sp. NPDC086787 TaxID=3365759 RepID=UPI0038200F58